MSEPTKLRLKREKVEEYEAEDGAKIQAALLQLGFQVALEDVIAAYREYSEDEWCAGWMGLSGFTDLEYAVNRLIENYLEPVQ